MRDGDHLSAILGDPHWFVEDYDPLGNTFSVVRANRETLGEQAFLDHRWNRGDAERRKLPLAATAQNFDTAIPPRLNFIWHTSFCCSTLLAAALDWPGCNLSLREPLAMVPVADAVRASRHAAKPAPARLSELVFQLLARRFTPGEGITVKPSNFANVLVRDAVRLSRGKMLFLFSDLESFLISIAKSGTPLRKYARRLFGNIAGDGGGALPWSAQEIFQMTDLEIAAIAWHLQIAEFRRGLAALDEGRAASLDCDAFLVDPAETLTRLDRFLGLGLGEARLAEITSGPLLTRHAKNPAHPYDARRRRDENAAVRQFLGPDLRRTIEWSYRACPGTPRGAPLPAPLVSLEKAYS